MGRVLSIDYGTKRTGIAVSDPMKIIAGALATVPTHNLMSFIKEYLSMNEVETIIVGKPLQMNGQPSDSFIHIKPFVSRLKSELAGIKVVYHDERFTSKMAQQTIFESGAKRKKRQDKALVDRVSATIILQSYLDTL